MSAPSTIARRTRECLENDDPSDAAETATALVESLLVDELSRAFVTDAIRGLVDAFPTVAARILPILDEYVVAGFDLATPVYRTGAFALALEVATQSPDHAHLLEASLYAVDKYVHGGREIESFFVSMSGENPAFLASVADLLTVDCEGNPPARLPRSWAIARAATRDPASFEDAVDARRDSLADGCAERIDATKQLGGIGFVAPELVEPAVTDLVDAIERADGRIRLVSIEAFGLVFGTTRDFRGRHGNPATDVDIGVTPLEVLEPALADPDDEIAAEAALAMTRSAAHDEKRSRCAASVLLAHLDRDDDRTETILDCLEQLTDGDSLPPRAADRLIPIANGTAEVASRSSSRERRTALRLLGRIDGASRNRIDETLIDGLAAAQRLVRRGAVDGVRDALSRRDSSSPTLIDALIKAAQNDDDASVGDDAYEALAETDSSDRVIGALAAGFERPDAAEAIAETACALEAESVVGTLIERLVAAFESETADDPETQSTPYGVDRHLTDKQRAYVNALDVVSRTAPALLVPYAADLVAVITDDSTPNSVGVARALSELALDEPSELHPYAERLVAHLTGTPNPDAVGYHLETALALEGIDRETVATVCATYDAEPLVKAVGRIRDVAPLQALRIATDLETRLRTTDDHCEVTRWIHDVDALAVSPNRVGRSRDADDRNPGGDDRGSASSESVPGADAATLAALKLARIALESTDEWIRWDGTETFATVAERDPHCVGRDSDILVDALDDVNDEIPQRIVRALGDIDETLPDHSDDSQSRVDRTTVRESIEPFRAHPVPGVRRRAERAFDSSDSSDRDHARGTRRGTPRRSGRDPRSLALDHLRSGTTVDPDALLQGPESDDGALPETVRLRNRIDLTATVLPATVHPDEDVCERARRLSYELVDADPATAPANERVPPTYIRSTNPIERAVAASVIGAATHRLPLPSETEIERLVSLATDDDEPVVRRWAIASIAAIGSRSPTAILEYAPALASRLEAEDPVTSAFLARAFADVGSVASAAIGPAILPLARCATAPSKPLRHAATDALVRAPPEDLASVSEVVECLRVRLEDASRVSDAVATLASTLALGDPDAASEICRELIENATHPQVRRAIALIADARPERIAPYDAELAETANDRHIRRALARVHSERYPKLLRAHVVSDRELPESEVELAVDFAVSAVEPDRRTHVLRSISLAVENEPSVAERAVRALLERRTDRDPTRRQHVAACLAEKPSILERVVDQATLTDDVVDALLENATDHHWEVRSRSIDALETVLSIVPDAVLEAKSAELIDIAIAQLSDEHGFARRHAADVLAAIPISVRRSANVFDRVHSLAKSDDETGVLGATHAIATLGVVDETYGRAFELLGEGVSASDPYLQQTALEGVEAVARGVLENADDEADLEAILASTSHPIRDRVRTAIRTRNPEIRTAACRCLGAVGTDDDVSLLEDRVEDPYPRVREAATAALERLSDRDKPDSERSESSSDSSR